MSRRQQSARNRITRYAWRSPKVLRERDPDQRLFLISPARFRAGRHAPGTASRTVATLWLESPPQNKSVRARRTGTILGGRKKSSVSVGSESQAEAGARFRVWRSGCTPACSKREARKIPLSSVLTARTGSRTSRVSRRDPRGQEEVLLSLEESIGVASRLAPSGEIICRDPSGSFSDEKSIRTFRRRLSFAPRDDRVIPLDYPARRLSISPSLTFPRLLAFSSKHESAFFNFRRRSDVMPGICVTESIDVY